MDTGQYPGSYIMATTQAGFYKITLEIFEMPKLGPRSFTCPRYTSLAFYCSLYETVFIEPLTDRFYK